MRILVVSDTHGQEENLKRVLKEEGTPDCVIHLGDSECTEEYFWSLVQCPVHMVAGNCDYFTRLPKVKFVELGGCRIMITHGHYYYVSVGMRDLEAEARTNGCSVAMFGHTHRPYLDQSSDDLTVLNPGSLSFPRQEGRRASYVMMEVKDGEKPAFTFHYL